MQRLFLPCSSFTWTGCFLGHRFFSRHLCWKALSQFPWMLHISRRMYVRCDVAYSLQCYPFLQNHSNNENKILWKHFLDLVFTFRISAKRPIVVLRRLSRQSARKIFWQKYELFMQNKYLYINFIILRKSNRHSWRINKSSKTF